MVSSQSWTSVDWLQFGSSRRIGQCSGHRRQEFGAMNPQSMVAAGHRCGDVGDEWCGGDRDKVPKRLQLLHQLGVPTGE